LLRFLFLITLLLVTSFSIQAQKAYDYPSAPRSNHEYEYHGEKVKAPFHWMENPEDPRLAKWLSKQEDLSEKLQKKQTHYWNLKEQVGKTYWGEKSEFTDEYEEEPDLYSKYEFEYDYNRKLDGADIIYKIKGSQNNFKKLVDISELNKEGEQKRIVTNIIPSKKHDFALILISVGGSDWREGYFYNLLNGKRFADTLKYIRNGSHFSWHKKGVFYDRYRKPNEGKKLLDVPVGQALYYHEIGTSQNEDQFLYQSADTSGQRSFKFYKLRDEYLILNHYYNIRGQFYKAVSSTDINLNNSFLLKNFLLFPEDTESYFKVNMVDENDTAYITTNMNAPNGKVMKSSIHNRNKLITYIPEYDMDLRSLNPIGQDYIGAVYRKDGVFSALIFDKKAQLVRRINFPQGKKVNHFSQSNIAAKYLQFSVSSFYHPDIWYQLSLEDFSMKPIVKIQVPFRVDDLETRYVKYRSKDGEEIPMYITCLKETELDGNNPTLLYGYGGYGATSEPFYNKSMALWLLHGGIYAVPNIRGGGAEGAEWALAGRNLNKQNAINDFIAAGEYLISEKYTNRGKLAARGGSHGGLLVSAAAIQRPNLFKAIVAEAGSYDMLRFENFTVGGKILNINEFGSVENNDEYENLKSYSPLHNIKEGVHYPNILLITGENDDRVPPFHSYKFLASLQEKGSPYSLYQMYIVKGAGHGIAVSIEERIDKMMFIEHFLFDQLDLKFW